MNLPMSTLSSEQLNSIVSGQFIDYTMRMWLTGRDKIKKSVLLRNLGIYVDGEEYKSSRQMKKHPAVV
jgi:hypothetical protein